MRILYVVNTLQHPSMRGSLRHYHFLIRLARRHDVSLLALAKEGGRELTADAVREIGALVERLEILEATGPDRFARQRQTGRLRRIAGRVRRTLGIRDAVRQMEETVDDLTRRQSFDVALCHGKELYSIVAGLRGLPTVVDACDATPLRQRALIQGATASDLPWLLLRYARSVWVERRLVRKADRLTYISPRDRDAVVPPGRRARVIPNGIDLEYWRRDDRTADPDCLVFTGVMDYPPNVDAARWLADEILPRVQEVRPDAELLVAGRDPTPDLRRLGEEAPDVTVTGYVEDMRPWLARGTVFAAGLRSASGQQNKVLEALAMEVPVVATPATAEGFRLEGRGEPPMRVAADPDAFSDRVAELLEDAGARSELAREGRRFVEERFDWDRSAAALEEECLAAAGEAESEAAPEEGRRLRPVPDGVVRRLKKLADLDGEEWSIPGWGAALLALLPLLLVGVTGAAAIDGKAAYRSVVREDGIAELLQVLAWIGVAGLGLVQARGLRREGASWEAWLYGLVGALALFVAGEEISWGQRIVGWSTPEQLASLNRQGETNVHNVHAVETLFQWGKILAGAYGSLLPLLARPLDPALRLINRHAGPARTAEGRGSPETPGGSPVSRMVPPPFLASFFVLPFGWGLYRMFAPRPPAYEWAIAEFGEIVELQLALGAFLFLLLVHRNLRSGDADGGEPRDATVGAPARATGRGTEAGASPRQLLRALERAGVRHVLLRGREHLDGAGEDPGGRTLGRPDREIDLLVARTDLPELARQLGRRGFTTLPDADHEPHRFFVRYDEDRGGWLKLDVVTELLYGRSVFALRGSPSAEEVLGNARRRGGVPAPAPEDEFTVLLSHCLLDKGGVAVRHRKRLSSLSREVREAGGGRRLERRVNGLFGTPDAWKTVRRAVDEGAWSELEDRATSLGRRLFRSDPVGTAWRALRSRALGLLRPLLDLLRRRGLSVALLAPDGAGKTTLARSLARRWPIPVRVIYMGINREANTVEVPGGDAVAAAARRLKQGRWPPIRWLGKGLGFGLRAGEQLLRSTAARLRHALGHLVVFDRFTYDAWRSGQPTSLKGRVRRRLLEAPVPRPDLVLVLSAPAEVLRSRKDEHPLDELRHQREGYLELADRLPAPVTVVDADRPADRVLGEVLSLAWRRYGGSPNAERASGEVPSGSTETRKPAAATG